MDRYEFDMEREKLDQKTTSDGDVMGTGFMATFVVAATIILLAWIIGYVEGKPYTQSSSVTEMSNTWETNVA